MSLASDSLLKTLSGTSEETKMVRMATLVSASYSEGGRKWKVKFYGEDAVSDKAYSSLGDTSMYAANSKVLMIKINGSWVIGGVIN